MDRLRFVNPATLETYKTKVCIEAVKIAESLGYVPATTEDAEKCKELRGLK